MFHPVIGRMTEIEPDGKKDLSIYRDEILSTWKRKQHVISKSRGKHFSLAVQNQKTIRVLYRALCYGFL